MSSLFTLAIKVGMVIRDTNQEVVGLCRATPTCWLEGMGIANAQISSWLLRKRRNADVLFVC